MLNPRNRVIDMLVEHHDELPRKPVTRKARRHDLEILFRETLPVNGMNPSSVTMAFSLHADFVRSNCGWQSKLLVGLLLRKR